MGVERVDIETFLKLAIVNPVIDARSPGEFKHAHIPGAHSLPLFTDDERKIVGTAYKQESKQRAIKIGLDFFGKKMVQMVEEVERIMEDTSKSLLVKNKLQSNNNQAINTKTVLIHCWRGGMRSAGVAWLLDLYGFKVFTLAGGYKAYRQWALQQFEQEYNIKLVGGYTGSGKTDVLNELKKRGELVVDLELLAHHKGSAFGNIGLPEQPSQEMFENKLAIELWKATTNTSANVSNHATINNQESNPVMWLEDESQRIGTVNIPNELYKQMRAKPVVFLDIPFEERLDYIVKGYGKGDKEKLINAIVRIKKRLGPLETKTALNFLVEDNLKESFRVLLLYYDKWYLKSLLSRENVETLISYIELGKVDAAANCTEILKTKLKTDDV